MPSRHRSFLSFAALSLAGCKTQQPASQPTQAHPEAGESLASLQAKLQAENEAVDSACSKKLGEMDKRAGAAALHGNAASSGGNPLASADCKTVQSTYQGIATQIHALQKRISGPKNFP